MQYVYLLQSQKNKTFYIGCTSNIKERLDFHNQGRPYHTKKYKPWKLIYFEDFFAREDAYNREVGEYTVR